MTGARLVHDTLEQEGWSVEIAAAHRVKGMAPLACKTDRIDSLVLAMLSHRDPVPAIWLPDPEVRSERELARFRLHLVKHRSALKHRIHSTLINFGRPRPVSDLFGLEGRELLARLDVPEPWRGNLAASLALIDHLERQIEAVNRRLRDGHADHPYIPLLMAPGSAGCSPLRSPPRSAPSSASLTAEARRLHRPLPAGRPVRGVRAPRPALKARPHLPALGPAGGDDARAQAPRLLGALPAHQAPTGQAARRQGPRSTSPAAPPTRSGTCSLEVRSSLGEAPLFVWRPPQTQRFGSHEVSSKAAGTI
jgi:transposase